MVVCWSQREISHQSLGRFTYYYYLALSAICHTNCFFLLLYYDRFTVIIIIFNAIPITTRGGYLLWTPALSKQPVFREIGRDNQERREMLTFHRFLLLAGGSVRFNTLVLQTTLIGRTQFQICIRDREWPIENPNAQWKKTIILPYTLKSSL